MRFLLNNIIFLIYDASFFEMLSFGKMQVLEVLLTRKAELVFGSLVSSLFWGWMAREVESLPFYTSLELFSPGSVTVEISLLSCGHGYCVLGTCSCGV